MRGANTFKQADVTRALRGAVAAGFEVQRYEIDKDGKIVVVIADGREAAVTDVAPLDAWRADRGAG